MAWCQSSLDGWALATKILHALLVSLDLPLPLLIGIEAIYTR